MKLTRNNNSKANSIAAGSRTIVLRSGIIYGVLEGTVKDLSGFKF